MIEIEVDGRQARRAAIRFATGDEQASRKEDLEEEEGEDGGGRERRRAAGHAASDGGRIALDRFTSFLAAAAAAANAVAAAALSWRVRSVSREAKPAEKRANALTEARR